MFIEAGKFHRGHSISPLLVLKCRMHMGIQGVSTNVGLTCGTTEKKSEFLCQNKEPSKVQPHNHFIYHI